MEKQGQREGVCMFMIVEYVSFYLDSTIVWASVCNDTGLVTFLYTQGCRGVNRERWCYTHLPCKSRPQNSQNTPFSLCWCHQSRLPSCASVCVVWYTEL